MSTPLTRWMTKCCSSSQMELEGERGAAEGRSMGEETCYFVGEWISVIWEVGSHSTPQAGFLLTGVIVRCWTSEVVDFQLEDFSCSPLRPSPRCFFFAMLFNFDVTKEEVQSCR